jgi:hypothetical protein
MCQNPLAMFIDLRSSTCRIASTTKEFWCREGSGEDVRRTSYTLAPLFVSGYFGGGLPSDDIPAKERAEPESKRSDSVGAKRNVMPYDDGQVAVALRPPLDGGVWAWNSFVLCRVRDREILAFAELCDGDVIWLHGLDGERAALLEANRGADIDKVKRLCADGAEPRPNSMRGLTIPRTVRVESVTVIGKEVIVDPTDTDESPTAEMLSVTEVIEYFDPAQTLETLRSQVSEVGIRAVSKRAKLSRRHVQEFVNMRSMPHPKTVAKLEVAIRKCNRSCEP